ncbi:MAG: UDP-N-acetylmuramate:L-alanyl-gamma-D-glutamyl-meso-diaminopimelate ligase [Acidiferrobacterales bacterium]|nr:UDP-N-acetylmuramate:L-alanyl-gamma-D-glutamyl-meso-diaminopimelate ligase [Acidiferrobacterales bacterium]
MHIYIAGICGTFMAGIAQLAQSMGVQVSGCDANVYPPMSDVLADAGITAHEGYDPASIPDDVDTILIGNALSRGNPLVEHVLTHRLRYQSGAEWLKESVLRQRKVIAVAGTHGKTSTASMITWILESAGMSPGFLIGGKPGNFDQSARLGEGDYFVIEADEYDTAFFDKRSKFVHYLPHIAVLNNLEFDHADIFDDLSQIQKQFHHLIRIVPASGAIVSNLDSPALETVLSQGCWSPVTYFSTTQSQANWYAASTSCAATEFSVNGENDVTTNITWDCMGEHNMQNALAALATASLTDVSPTRSAKALKSFIPSARRLEWMAETEDVVLFQDFAHHPTAIKTTLETLRQRYPNKQILAIIEPRSNTMQMGWHRESLGDALSTANRVWFYLPQRLNWRPEDLGAGIPLMTESDAGTLVQQILSQCDSHQGRTGSVIIAMSNGSFDAIPQQIATLLMERKD